MSSKNVCDTQNDFNHAFHDAVKYVDRKHEPKVWVQLVGIGIVFILVIWALILAMRVSNGPEQKLHIVLAIIFAPAYIVSYYLNG